MSTFMQSLIVLAVIWVLAYRRAHMGNILAGVAITLLALTWYGSFAWLPWLVLLVIALFYFEDNLRRDKLTRPVYQFFKRVLPPMSATEQEALEAGDTWWEADLFRGAPDWKKWLDIKRTHKIIEWGEVQEINETFVDATTLAGQACAGGACLI